MVSYEKIFKVFYIDIEGKYAPPPSGHVFWQIMLAWTILVEGYQRNIPAKLYLNRFIGFWEENF